MSNKFPSKNFGLGPGGYGYPERLGLVRAQFKAATNKRTAKVLRMFNRSMKVSSGGGALDVDDH